MTVNKDEALWRWAQTNPYLTDSLVMGFLAENEGSCAIVPIAGEAVERSFIDGSAEKRYDFMLQVMFMQSRGSNDTTNTDNLFTLRKWQDWIDEQEAEGNYPNFGEKCGLYELKNMSNAPQIAIVYEDGKAVYQFPASLFYKEDK